MRTCRAILLLGLVALSSPGTASEGQVDFSGVWHMDDNDLVVRRTGSHSWIGYLTEGRGVTTGFTWHFQALGGDRFQFWVMREGGATTEKLDDQQVEVTGTLDEITLRLSGRKGKRNIVPLRRIFAPIPESVAEVRIGFVGGKKDRLSAAQDMDARLVRAFETAVATAQSMDAGLKRINIAATIDKNVGFSGAHSRWRRRALDVDRVNGSDAGHWKEDVAEKLAALKAGEAPDIDIRRDYAGHATALVLALLLQEDLAEVICPAVLDDRTRPYLLWWLGKNASRLEKTRPISFWEGKIDAMLKATRSSRRKNRGWIHVSLKDPEMELCLHRRAKDKKYDRE